MTQAPLRFDGPAYKAAVDQARLTDQFGRILGLMRDGEWRTLRRIASLLGYPEASVSAQLRHMRKPRFGGYVVERSRNGDGGTWLYRVLPAITCSAPAKKRRADERIRDLVVANNRLVEMVRSARTVAFGRPHDGSQLDEELEEFLMRSCRLLAEVSP